MDMKTRIERTLDTAVCRAANGKAPPMIAEAIRYAVFPGGARVRPRLCLAVAAACGDDAPEVSEGAAAAIELLHCASLVHDDLPCFDDAALRRGRPSVHAAYGEATALLAGDALIVLAFQVVAEAAQRNPARTAPLVTLVASSVGLPLGIVAGQAWESEPTVPLEAYHGAKTGALFVGAAAAGAVAAGSDPAPWRRLGERLGAAYQVADDLRDGLCEPEEIGKPVGQDPAHLRPNALQQLGARGAVARLESLIAGAIGAIPRCPGAAELEALIASEAKRLMPKKLTRSAA